MDAERSAHVVRRGVERVWCVGDEDDQRHLGDEVHVGALPCPTGESDGAVLLGAGALEEGDRGRKVAGFQAVFGTGLFEEALAGGVDAVDGGGTVLAGGLGVGHGAAEGVVVGGGVFGDGGQDAAFPGEQRVAGGDVGLPGDLDGVGGVVAFPRFQCVEQQDVGAGGAVDVLEADARAAGDDLVGVAAGADGLCPGEVLRVDVFRGVRTVARREVGHVGVGLGALRAGVAASVGHAVGAVQVACGFFGGHWLTC